MTRNDGHGVVKERVDELVATGRRQIVLDLGQVSYMDATCIGGLVGACLTTRDLGGTVKFSSVSGRIVELSGVAKLDTVFEREDASAQNFSGA